MPTQGVSVKFGTEGLNEVLREFDKIEKGFDELLNSAVDGIQKSTEAAERAAKAGLTDAYEQADRDRANSAQRANQVIAQSYRELGVRQERDIESQRRKAISAYEAIQKSGTASASDLERASEALRRKLDQLDRQIEQVDKSAREAGGGFTVLKGAFASFLGNLGVNLLQGGVQALQQFVVGSVSTRAELSKLRDQLSLLEGNEAAGAAAFDRISEFAKTTPFEINEVTQAYVKLGNRGIKPTLQQLTQLGDLALSQNKSLDQLVEAVLDAQTGENERLKEFGIRAQRSGNQVSLSFKGVTKDVELTEQAVLDAIVGFGTLEGVAGNIEKAGNRLDGVGSNLADSFTRLQDALGGAFEPFLIGAGKALVDLLTPLGDPQLWAPLTDAFNELLNAFGAAAPDAQTIQEIIANGLRVAIEFVAALVRDIAQTIRDNPALIEQSIEAMQVLAVAIGAVLAALGLAVAGLLKIQGAIVTAGDAVQDSLVEAINETPVAAERAAGGIEAIFSAMASAIQIRILEFRIWWLQVQQAAERAWQGIQSIWVAGLNTVQELILRFRLWWRQVEQAAISVWQQIQAFISRVLGTVGGLIDRGIIQPFQAALQWGDRIRGAIASWTKPIQDAINLLKKFTTGLSSALGGAAGVAATGGPLSQLKDQVPKAGPSLPPGKTRGFHPDSARVTSGYKTRQRPGHAGVDYGVPQGTPITNVYGAGVVTQAAFTSGACGGALALRLPSGERVRFCHLSQINVREGQVIPLGAVMGLSGGAPGTKGAGRSTGPHVHFEYYPAGAGASDYQRYKGRFSRGGGDALSDSQTNQQHPDNIISLPPLPQAKPSDTLTGPTAGSIVIPIPVPAPGQPRSTSGTVGVTGLAPAGDQSLTGPTEGSIVIPIPVPPPLSAAPPRAQAGASDLEILREYERIFTDMVKATRDSVQNIKINVQGNNTGEKLKSLTEQFTAYSDEVQRAIDLGQELERQQREAGQPTDLTNRQIQFLFSVRQALGTEQERQIKALSDAASGQESSAGDAARQQSQELSQAQKTLGDVQRDSEAFMKAASELLERLHALRVEAQGDPLALEIFKAEEQFNGLIEQFNNAATQGFQLAAAQQAVGNSSAETIAAIAQLQAATGELTEAPSAAIQKIKDEAAAKSELALADRAIAEAQKAQELARVGKEISELRARQLDRSGGRDEASDLRRSAQIAEETARQAVEAAQLARQRAGAATEEEKAAVDALIERVTTLNQLKLDELRAETKTTVSLFQQFGQIVGSQLQSAFQSFLSSSEGFGQRILNLFKDLVTGILQEIARIALARAISGIVGGIFGGSGGSIGSAIGGGGFADGGIFRGPQSGGLALLHGTEGIINQRALRFFGEDLIDNLNSLRPGAALQNIANRSPSAGGLAPVMITMNVATPDANSFRYSEMQMGARAAEQLVRARVRGGGGGGGLR